MRYAIVKNNQISSYGNLSKLFPNTSFPKTGPSKDWLDSNNVKAIISEMPFDRKTQKTEFTEPYIQDGSVFDVVVVDLSNEELALNAENELREKVNAQRARRDRLLAMSDHKMLKDNLNAMTLEEQQAWIDYRQALRDIPAQADFNSGDVVFPTPPSPLSAYDY